MRQRRFQFRPQLEALENRLCPSSTTVLPISAFLSQQGTITPPNYPVPEQLGFSNSTIDPGSTSTDPNRFISVDYTGTEASYLLQHGINLHTQITGFVTETPMAGGVMEVSIDLEATNALTWVVNTAGIDVNDPSVPVNTAPLELGYRVPDLVANPSLKPALSDVHFQFTFQEQTGAPLPDLVQALIVGNAPPGFAPERVDFQSWGTGTLDAATTVGTPGQTALVSTSQVADLTNPSLPGTLADGFFQEPIDIVPVASASTHVGYLNGTLFVADTSNTSDVVLVEPTANGGAFVASNLGGWVFPSVTRVIVGLAGGNNLVQIGNLRGATIDVSALDGNNYIAVGGAAKLVVSVGGGNNLILIGTGNTNTGNTNTGNTNTAAQFLFVGGNGNNFIDANNANPAEILVAGNGNNFISASGAGDFIEVLGNGNNLIQDTGTDDLVWLGGDGNNDIRNDGAGSMTVVLAGKGHNHIH